MSGALKQFLRPGSPGYMAAGSALADPKRRSGFPWLYQWAFPGPNSRQVNARGNAQFPAVYGTGVPICTYTVPEGMRFSLRAVMVDAVNSAWIEGSGDLLFTLSVTSGGGGSRNVDYFVAVPTRLGNTKEPWPIDGRLEFQSLDVLTWTMTPVANVILGPDRVFGFAALIGHEYPNSEAGDD